MEKRIVSFETTFESKEADPIPVVEETPPKSRKSRRRKNRKWPKRTLFAISVGLGLSLVSLLFLKFAMVGSTYERFEPSLLMVTVTFAVFAVNFSFLEYQLSPYRALFRGIAWPHVLSAIAVLSLAIIPIGAALLGFWPGRVSAFLLPIVALSSVVLILVARSCSDPATRIRAALSRKHFGRFLVQLATAASEELEHVDKLNLSSPDNMPSHEWDQRIPPRISFFDPFDSMLALASAATTNGDGQVYDMAVDAILKLVASTSNEKEMVLADGEKADYKVRSVVVSHAHDRLAQLARMTLEADKTDRYSRSLGDILGSFLRVEAAHARQTDEFSRIVLSVLAFLAIETLKRGWKTSALRTLVIARECANKGLDSPSKDESRMFFFELVRFPLVAQSLADCAMDKRDTEFLYRCMEMLGYIGCAAVKANQHDLGAQCAQSLVQIARKCRFLKLECFWTMCGMLPWQHARERIDWMLSWVPRVPEDQRKWWMESLSEAYSRMSGSTIAITLTWEDNKPTFSRRDTKTPHRITYSDTDTVTYDYSDESMLRDLQLY